MSSIAINAFTSSHNVVGPNAAIAFNLSATITPNGGNFDYVIKNQSGTPVTSGQAASGSAVGVSLTAPAVAGTYTYTLTVSESANAANTASQALTFNVQSPTTGGCRSCGCRR